MVAVDPVVDEDGEPAQPLTLRMAGRERLALAAPLPPFRFAFTSGANFAHAPSIEQTADGKRGADSGQCIHPGPGTESP